MQTKPGRLRIRTEDTERLSVADLRPGVAPHAQQTQLSDGTLLELYWQELRGVFQPGGGRGRGYSLRAVCPSCGHCARVLRKVQGESSWGCCRCLPLIQPSQRRSGCHKGRRKCKPTTWRLRQLSDQQAQVAKLLGLQCWPPPMAAWERSHLHPTRRLRERRREALLARIDALETLRVITLGIALSNRIGIDVAADSSRHVLAAQGILSSTRWALQDSWYPLPPMLSVHSRTEHPVAR
jgi:hypothetical protein